MIKHKRRFINIQSKVSLARLAHCLTSTTSFFTHHVYVRLRRCISFTLCLHSCCISLRNLSQSPGVLTLPKHVIHSMFTTRGWKGPGWKVTGQNGPITGLLSDSANKLHRHIWDPSLHSVVVGRTKIFLLGKFIWTTSNIGGRKKIKQTLFYCTSCRIEVIITK